MVAGLKTSPGIEAAAALLRRNGWTVKPPEAKAQTAPAKNSAAQWPTGPEDVQAFLDAADSLGSLSNWEQDFLTSTRERLTKYGDRIAFSDRQLAVLNKIREKL